MFSARAKAITILLGIAVGFAIAVDLGRRAEGYSKPSNFVRFHYTLAPESWYYPPFPMLERLALSRTAEGKTLVIIAGNSVLNGFGQTESEVWHLRLQEQLGERYAVVNLSFRGTLPCEGATLVAESLLQRGVRLILISNTSPSVVGRSAGGAYGRYYWNGLYKNRLLEYPARTKDIADWEATLPLAEKEKQNEIRSSSKLDALFHFQSLWHHVGYRHLFTLWSPLTGNRFWRARAMFQDAMPGAAPLRERFRDYPEQEMEIVRSFSVGLAELDEHNQWRATAISQEVTSGLIESMFPPALRSRTLMIQTQNAPFYRKKLTQSELTRDNTIFSAYERLWQKHGVACHTVGESFTDNDFRDRTHLSASGGEKLAGLVAGYIKEFKNP